MSSKTLGKIAIAFVCIAALSAIGYFINFLLQERHRKITIARDTTFILGPTFADGTIDCLSALNARFAQGVTPETNAAVPIYLTTNPSDLSGWRLQQFLDTVGIKQAPDPREIYIDFPSFMLDVRLKAAADPQQVRDKEDDLKEDWSDLIDTRAKAAWSRTQDSDSHAWLERNTPALQLALEASRRPRFFCPMIGRTDLGSTLHTTQFVLDQILALRNLLAVHAMRALGEKDFAAFRSDVLAQHRLGRLVTHAPNLVQYVIGIRVVQQADDLVIVALPQLSLQQTTELLSDLRALPPVADAADCEDQCERLWSIAETATLARFGPAVQSISDDPADPLPVPASLGFQAPIHFDDILRRYNRLYDLRIAAARLPTYSQRKDALRKLDADLSASRVKATSTSTSDMIESMLLSGILSSDSPFRIQDETTQKSRLTRLALQMVFHRATHGAYPKSLEALGTDPAVRESCKDLFADDQPIRYLPAKSLIYSIGRNQKDDAGINQPPPPRPINLRGGIAPGPGPAPDYPDDLAVQLPP